MNPPVLSPPATRPIDTVMVFLLAGAFYLATMAPTIGLGDTALLLDQIQRLTITTHVNNHNLTILTGWLLNLLPFGSAALRGNLVSVLFGALTVSFFYQTLC